MNGNTMSSSLLVIAVLAAITFGVLVVVARVPFLKGFLLGEKE